MLSFFCTNLFKIVNISKKYKMKKVISKLWKIVLLIAFILSKALCLGQLIHPLPTAAKKEVRGLEKCALKPAKSGCVIQRCLLERMLYPITQIYKLSQNVKTWNFMRHIFIRFRNFVRFLIWFLGSKLPETFFKHLNVYLLEMVKDSAYGLVQYHFQ